MNEETPKPQVLGISGIETGEKVHEQKRLNPAVVKEYREIQTRLIKVQEKLGKRGGAISEEHPGGDLRGVSRTSKNLNRRLNLEKRAKALMNRLIELKEKLYITNDD